MGTTSASAILTAAIALRWGVLWAPGVVVPYIWSLVTLSPRPELISSFSVILQVHVLSFWVFLAIFPFTRLVHFITFPIMYLTRPWQRVVRMREVERIG